MSVVAGDGTPARTRLHRLRMWLGHHAARANMTALVVTVAAGATVRSVIPPHNPLHTVVAVFMVLCLTVTVCLVDTSSVYHDCNVCERDLADTLNSRNSPFDDPDTAVDRARPRLRLWHWLAAHQWWYGATVVALIVVFIALSVLIHIPEWARETPMMLVVVILCVVYRLNSTHRRLRPWCLICRRGGGGGFSLSDPSPTRQHTHVHLRR
jgi:hypothetical protein